MSEQERQRLSANETNQYRGKATLFRICQARYKLESVGKKISVKALCTEADINRDTFYHFKNSVGFGAYQLLFNANRKSEEITTMLSHDLSKLKQHEKRDLFGGFHHLLMQLASDAIGTDQGLTQPTSHDAEGNRVSVCPIDPKRNATPMRTQKPEAVDSGGEECPF